MAAKKRAAKPAKASEAPSGAKVAKQEYLIADVDALKVHPKNPKKGDKEAIGESVDANDFYGAIVVQKATGYILAGNHRYMVAKEKGLREVPVILLDCDDAKAERILLADNRTAELGTVDDSLLRKLLEDKEKSGGLLGTGYDHAALARLRAKASAPPKTPKREEGTVKHMYNCPNCHFEWT